MPTRYSRGKYGRRPVRVYARNPYRFIAYPPAENRKYLSYRRKQKPGRLYFDRNVLTVKQQIMPDKMRVKLPYYSQPEIYNEVADASYAEYKFNANDLFDFEEEVAGHQPRGSDQWKTLYGRYLVTGLKFQVAMYPTSQKSSTAGGVMGMCGIRFQSDGQEANISSITDVMEMPLHYGDKHRVWNRSATNGTYDSNSDRPVWFSGYVSMKQLAKRWFPDKKWPEEFVTSNTSDPTNILQMMLWIATSKQEDTADTTANENILPTFAARVKVTFYVTFSDPLDVSVS